jgi:hypothetical protein
MRRADRPRWPLFLIAVAITATSAFTGVLLGMAAWNVIAGRPW